MYLPNNYFDIYERFSWLWFWLDSLDLLPFFRILFPPNTCRSISLKYDEFLDWIYEYSSTLLASSPLNFSS